MEVLSDQDYLKAIDAKLKEELSEYYADPSLEELADLVEVIHAAVVARGYSLHELEEARIEKAKKYGAFQKKIQLIEIF